MLIVLAAHQDGAVSVFCCREAGLSLVRSIPYRTVFSQDNLCRKEGYCLLDPVFLWFLLQRGKSLAGGERK